MKIGQLATIVSVIGVLFTLVNLLLLVTLISTGSAAALSEPEAVVRAQKFELVDDQGRVRAQLLITEPTMQDGKQYAESVLFRLINENGRPGVKIGTGSDGSGMSLAGDSEKRDWSGVQILADGSASTVILTDKNGTVEQIQP